MLLLLSDSKWTGTLLMGLRESVRQKIKVCLESYAVFVSPESSLITFFKRLDFASSFNMIMKRAAHGAWE